MPKIQAILLFSVFFLSLIVPAMAQTPQETPPPGTTTAGPEGSEITPDEDFSQGENLGIGVTFGQTFLTGDDAGNKTGFNNAVGQGVFLTYRYRERLNVALKYWTSQHDGREKPTGDLNRSHVTIELETYLFRGLFSPYGIGGAGVYFSEFSPSSKQKRTGIKSSSVSTFGVLIGGGVDFEIQKNFVLGLSAIQHYSFKRRNSERKVDEAGPVRTVSLSAKTYF